MSSNNYNELDHSEHSASTSSNYTVSSAGNPAKRTRTSRACDTCRRKKIKCDVDSRNPCSTCHQYNWECTFNDTAKKRGPPKGYIESLENRLERMESLLKNITSDDEMFASNRRNEDLDNETSDGLQDRSKHVRFLGSSSGYHLMRDVLRSNGNARDSSGDGGEQQPMYVIRSFHGKSDTRMRKMNMDGDDLIVVKDATADEIEAQKAEDTLELIDDLIPRSVLSALVYTFFRDAQTMLSVVEKKDYLDAFEGRVSPPPAPLLTYAICTYACFLLKASDTIFEEAQVERDSVFQILLERATSLVRKEYLKPRIVTIQALVLLCAHPTYSTSSYRNWILAGMAVRMAQDLGLHRMLTTVELPKRGREKRKHLWHSVYITDRWCCAVMGRPLAIADSDCDVDLPLIQGFEGDENYTVFVNFAKLSAILGEVLRRLYSPRAKLNGYKTRAIEQTVHSLEKALDNWFLNVSEDYKVTEEDLRQIKLNPGAFIENSTKVTEGGPLTVCYHAVVLLLHRPFIVLEDEVTSPLVEKSLEICRSSAKQAIEIARSMPYMSIAKFGWNFAAYSVFQAALIHVYNSTSSNPEIAKEAKEYVHICIEECLGPLSKDIPAGPPLIPFLQTLSSLLKEGQGFGDAADHAGKNQGTHQQQPVQSIPFQQSYQNLSAAQASMPPANSHDFLSAMTGNFNQSWLFTGPENTPTLSQAAWQQLFSSAGAPFKDDLDDKTDSQGIDNLFMGSQPNNFYM